MGWNRKDAIDRIRKAYDETSGLALKPLTREMDLHNLSVKECRIVTGVHLYLDPVNFLELLEEARDDAAKLKKLLRHVHVYERLICRLLGEVDGGVRVHFQGTRLHAVFHKPYDTSDVSEPEVKRLVAAVQFVEQAKELSALLTSETEIEFKLESGLECGDTIATVNGQVGSRELLFIGSPANLPAKALTGEPGIRFCENAEKLRAKLPKPEPLPERWGKEVADDVAANPISRFELFKPEVSIDYEALGCRTADVEEGVTFFADIAGFTRHVAALVTDDDKVKALRAFHAARSEMHQVAARDYDGDFIQYQGDRIQSLHYEAKGTNRFGSKTIEAAAAIKEAFDLCREILPGFNDLGMTVGAACGRVLVTQVGLKGDRELIVLGRSVPTASQLQDGAEVGQVVINDRLWELLTSEEQAHFQREGDTYVAALSLDVLVAEEEAHLFDGRVKLDGSPVLGRKIVETKTGGIRPAKSYLPSVQ